jgi:hypothetical protein
MDLTRRLEALEHSESVRRFTPAGEVEKRIDDIDQRLFECKQDSTVGLNQLKTFVEGFAAMLGLVRHERVTLLGYLTL